MTNPLIRAWSAGSSSASVPYRAANTPPRSMSPTTTTGSPAARASPMLAMSVSRRLISAGLPAPSQMTTSYSARRSVEAVQGDLEQVPGVRAVLGGADLVARLAEHDDVGAGVAARLEQHRVHPRVWLDARRRGLHGLGPADLGAVWGDEGVEGHVLGLERRDPDSLPGQPAAQPGGEHAFPGVRGGPGDEQAALHGRIPWAAVVLAVVTPRP